MIDFKELTEKFVKVRDGLNQGETREAYRRCWKKPWKFYREHTPEEAMEILKRESEESI